MCYYQNIHSTPHFALLNFDARERECHLCGLAYPDPSSGSAPGSGPGDNPGDKCFAHSCCQVRRLVVIRSCKVGGARLEDDELCPQAFIEDVFVPVTEEVTEEEQEKLEGKGKEGREGKVHTNPVQDEDKTNAEGGDVVPDTVSDSMIMEFWPEDRPSVVVMVYCELEGCADD
ncbi:hypothetical protein F5X97DRAFT_328876 [Nemania serpens]|nr:hypothetical protein F5X97DRAFT_328876 [Nemania serpens]